MCGICGIVDRRGADPARLGPMMARLVHRGPDDEGHYHDGPAALGHRRLSIIDLSHGRQPISDSTGRLHIVFNGEIYNYRELRDELLADGQRFETETDTEVIVQLYRREGPACVERLRGMFAFAIWDDRRRELFAARDRLGQKPFFYAETSGSLAFASEIKALLADDPGLAELDPEAFDEYLALRVVTPPRTLFRRVRKLPPAHWLRYSPERGLEIRRYWDLEFEPKLRGSDAELLEALEEKLIETLRLHVVSDVPVGAFLSGGLDSTLVVALLAQHVLREPFDTFAGSLRYRDFDEAPHARLVAERYGTRHHEREIRPDVAELLPRMVAQLDEPTDALSVCTWRIAAIAREHVKVSLGGDGGDELFGGYDRYYGHGFAGHWARVPAGLRRRALGPLIERLPEGGWYKSVANQMRWIQALSFAEGGERYARSLGFFYFGRPERQALYGDALRRGVADFDPDDAFVAAWERSPAVHPIDRMIHVDSQLRLPDHSVMILDRTSMAHGLEARSPFLDHELFAFAARLPMRLKVRGRSLRRAQRALAERHLPRPLLERPKQGFASALPYMLRDEYRRLFAAMLRDPLLVSEGLLQAAPLRALLDEHESGRADHANRLWLLLCAEVWYRLFLGGESVEALEQAIASEPAPAAPSAPALAAAPPA